MCNITFAYERDPDDVYARDVVMSFGTDPELRYEDLVDMFVDFSRVLGYADATIEKYINMEDADDD